MAKGNTYFKHLKREYVFPIIEKKLEDLKAAHPNSDILNLGIGDIALPIAPTIAKSIEEAINSMASAGKQVYGYGPSQGYSFLRDTIITHKYPFLTPDEIFISDGINTDITGILELFHSSCTVAIPNPAYPAYLDSNLIAGRKNKITWMPCCEETGFVPKPPSQKSDLIYLCSPHNPTGVAMTRKDLEAFVAYAKENDAIILYDNAYEAFVTSPDVPKSIYEIVGAEDVALEFCSFSKSAGFTGLRCSYLVLPKKVTAQFGKNRTSLYKLWLKRQSIKFNGVAYPIQRGAEACFTDQGKLEIQNQVKHYLSQATLLKKGLLDLGYTCFGGINSPYIWWKTPNNISSWDFFDLLLKHCQLISVPGVGFGTNGEGFVRLSAFTSREVAQKALEKIKQLTSYLP
jgi:LL-diaminopimelate aminotransferase